MLKYGPFYDQHKQLLTLGQKLGAGGEGEVYALADDVHHAVKLYSNPTVLRTHKLIAMLAKPPDKVRGHVAVAWPTGLVCDAQGKVVGFMMPRVHGVRSLHALYHPKTRRVLAANITWQHLVNMAHNLASVVARVHAKGYVIGDLNESNILVNRHALVTLIDCDSMQVQTDDAIYRCLVSKAEYLAPELHNKDFRKVTRQQRHDLFALAVLLFMLLMEGVSPFAGVHEGKGPPPGLLDTMRTGNSPYLRFGKSKPAAIAPPFKMLPRNLRRLFQQSLRPRLWWHPLSWRKPSANMWQDALKQLEQTLITCASNPNHKYATHLKTCPWCARATTFGIDPYPASSTHVPVSTPAAPTQQRTSLSMWRYPWQRLWSRVWKPARQPVGQPSGQREHANYRTPLVLVGTLFILQDVINQVLTNNRYADKVIAFIGVGVAFYILLIILKKFKWTAIAIRVVEYTLRIFLIAYVMGALFY
jgi:DNA-binding helix-hairpin-helix protein with protein kinase domain